ncbi:MAG: hypothetical protein RL071_4570 [Pseudomonadota bacterium]|jgi:hypothetical protein
MRSSASALLPLLVLAACKPPPPPAAAPVGWHKEATGMAFECYFPPDWGKLPETDRKMARAAALDAMKEQWAGKRDGGMSLEEGVIDEVEVTLLGRPVQIEGVVSQNLEACRAAAGGGSVEAWASAIKALPGKLTAGECLTPLDYTMFDYLEIDTGWQRPLRICKGDKVRVWAPVADKFRITDKGPWINVEGDPAQPTTSGDWPCSIEGCRAGMFIMKFVTEAGVEYVKPVGAELMFEAPENGEISFSINDKTFYDNIWFKNGGITDHAAINVEPAR